MKALLVTLAIFAACSGFAAPKEWSRREALNDAERDIRTNSVEFCYWGGFAPRLVGVPDKYVRVARQYPKRMVGQGCVVTDEALNERQREYAETYNARVLAYLLKKK
jgi:hypothetical protein